MTKQTNGQAKGKDDSSGDVIIFGLDKNQKTLASRFPAKIADLAIKAAHQQDLSALKVATAEAAALAARLPVGRVHASGQGLLSTVRRDLYDQVVALANLGKAAAPPTGPDPDKTKAIGTSTGRIPKNEAGTEGNPAGSDGLPAGWKEIAAGHLVLAQESLHDGWWEAIVVERRDDMVTLRWRSYLDRPKVQLAMMQTEGPRPFVYGLGRKGARALREHGDRINDQIDWAEKNKRAGAIFMAHTLGVADFMVSLELACRARSDIELTSEAEIITAAPEQTRLAREPLRWIAESIERGKKERWSVVPDGLFGLSYPDGSAAYFLLELDRGTIPISRSGNDHRSIRRKLQTYYDGWRANRHEIQFGMKQVRVLTVTSSPERVRNMLKAVHDVTEGRGSNFFLFIDRQSLSTCDVLDALWTTGKGEAIHLTD
jgi:hypothetical protein